MTHSETNDNILPRINGKTFYIPEDMSIYLTEDAISFMRSIYDRDQSEERHRQSQYPRYVENKEMDRNHLTADELKETLNQHAKNTTSPRPYKKITIANAIITDCNLFRYDFTDVTFENCSISHCNFNQATFSSTNFKHCELYHNSFCNALVNDTDFKTCAMDYTNTFYCSVCIHCIFPPKFHVATLALSEWAVYVTPERTKIGCQNHDNDFWLSQQPGSTRIDRMSGGASTFWAQYHSIIKQTIISVMDRAGVGVDSKYRINASPMKAEDSSIPIYYLFNDAVHTATLQRISIDRKTAIVQDDQRVPNLWTALLSECFFTRDAANDALDDSVAISHKVASNRLRVYYISAERGNIAEAYLSNADDGHDIITLESLAIPGHTFSVHRDQCHFTHRDASRALVGRNPDHITVSVESIKTSVLDLLTKAAAK